MPDKLALVTGASSGIGYWLARELGSRGYDLVVCSAGERLNDAVRDLERSGAQVTAVSADLAMREGVKHLWQAVEQLGRPIDVACINAGVGVGGLFWETDLEQELKMVELNCVGTVQLAKYVIKHMVPLHAGRILFTSSIAGEMVAPREAVYAATKAGLATFAESLAYEMRGRGVTVSGRVAQFGRGVMGDVSARLLQQFVRNLETGVLGGTSAD